jgi:FAD/FMN-containing dehydrogenase
MAIDPSVLERFKVAAGAGGWSDDPLRIAPHMREWRDRYHGKTPLMLMPADTAAVQRIVALAAETRTPLVPQGGNTGLVGGQIPSADGDELLLWMGRMARLRAVDPLNDCLIAEAGATLAAVQAAAGDAGRLFPLSLASEGSAQIGGLVSTNAGGTGVLAYGSMRALVLGLEAVLPDGSVFEGLSGLRKDNTGYDLSQLLTGAEGTLGVVTAAALRLFPAPRARECAIAGLDDPEQALLLLALAKAEAGTMLTGFELMPRTGVDFAVRHIAGLRDPLTQPYRWLVLLEVSLTGAAADGLLAALLEKAIARGLVLDAALAQSGAQAAEFWRLRESLSEAQKLEGGSIKHDVSVPVSAMARFIADAEAAVTQRWPGVRPVAFGHVGDGNVHFNVSQAPGADKTAFLALWPAMSDMVHALVHRYGGSISAEHGIGQMKAEEIRRYKDPAALAAMGAIKRALDPLGIMNPGKVLPRA